MLAKVEEEQATMVDGLQDTADRTPKASQLESVAGSMEPLSVPEEPTPVEPFAVYIVVLANPLEEELLSVTHTA